MKKIYRADIKSDLTTFKGMPNAQVFVLGTTVIGDGGTATYYWNDTSTATHDGDTVIQVTGVVIGRWIKLVLGSSINPNDFIQNQNATVQTANYQITGVGEAGGFKSSGSYSALAGTIRANYFNNTLTATANGDILVALDITPTFINGSFTSVSNYALRLGGNVDITTNSVYSIGNSNRILNSVWAGNLQSNTTLSLVTFNGNSITAKIGVNEKFRIFSTTGNVLIANTDLTTPTDSGDKLQVIGTAIVKGGGEALKVGTDTGLSNFAFIGLYARSATPTTRTGSIGFTSAGNILTVLNEISNGGININAIGANSVITVLVGDQFSIQPNSGSANPNWNHFSGNGVGGFFAFRLDSLISYGNRISLRSFNGSLASKTAIISGNILGEYLTGGYTTASTSLDATNLKSIATENWNSTSAGSKLEFYTTKNTTIVQALAMTIDQDQSIRTWSGGESLKVGTNTGNPDYAYISFYARTSAPSTVSATIGFTSPGSNGLLIGNNISSGSLFLNVIGSNADIIANQNRFFISPNTASTQNWNNIMGLFAGAGIKSGYFAEGSLGFLSGGPVFEIRTYNGTNNSRTVTVNNNSLGMLLFGGQNGTVSTNVYNGTTIKGIATETWSASAGGSKLEFYITPNTTITQTLALTIDQDQMLIGKNYRNNSSTLSGTVINFTAEGSRYQTIAADTNYTMTNTAEGIGIDIMITASGANRTISIAGVSWKGNPSLIITSGNTAWIFLKQINGTVWGSFIQ